MTTLSASIGPPLRRRVSVTPVTPVTPSQCESVMRNSGAKARKLGVIDTQLWVSEWRRAHPVKPVLCVAENLGAPVKTVEKWFSGQCSPSLTWVGPIFTAYGPEFVVAGMKWPPAWLRDAARSEKRKRLAAVRAEIEAEFSDLEFEAMEA